MAFNTILRTSSYIRLLESRPRRFGESSLSSENDVVFMGNS